MSRELRPKVGVGVLILKDNKILLGRRQSSHGKGEYAAIGGHLEHLESFEEGILRELSEECGPQLKIKNMRMLVVINLKKYKHKHYIDIGFVAEWEAGEPKVMEPDKICDCGWYDIESLP